MKNQKIVSLATVAIIAGMTGATVKQQEVHVQAASTDNSATAKTAKSTTETAVNSAKKSVDQATEEVNDSQNKIDDAVADQNQAEDQVTNSEENLIDATNNLDAAVKNQEAATPEAIEQANTDAEAAQKQLETDQKAAEKAGQDVDEKQAVVDEKDVAKNKADEDLAVQDQVVTDAQAKVDQVTDLQTTVKQDQTAVDEAAKQVAETKQAVVDAEAKLSEIKENGASQEDIAAAEQAVKDAQAAVDQTQKEIQDLQDSQEQAEIKLSDSRIAAIKRYKEIQQTMDGMIDGPWEDFDEASYDLLYQEQQKIEDTLTNKKNINDGSVIKQQFQASSDDKKQNVNLESLSDTQLMEINYFINRIYGDIAEQLGMSRISFTDGTLAVIKKTNKSINENNIDLRYGANREMLEAIWWEPEEIFSNYLNDFNASGPLGDLKLNLKQSYTMAELKEQIYNFVFENIHNDGIPERFIWNNHKGSEQIMAYSVDKYGMLHSFGYNYGTQEVWNKDKSSIEDIPVLQYRDANIRDASYKVSSTLQNVTSYNANLSQLQTELTNQNSVLNVAKTNLTVSGMLKQAQINLDNATATSQQAVNDQVIAEAKLSSDQADLVEAESNLADYQEALTAAQDKQATLQDAVKLAEVDLAAAQTELNQVTAAAKEAQAVVTADQEAVNAAEDYLYNLLHADEILDDAEAALVMAQQQLKSDQAELKAKQLAVATAKTVLQGAQTKLTAAKQALTQVQTKLDQENAIKEAADAAAKKLAADKARNNGNGVVQAATLDGKKLPQASESQNSNWLVALGLSLMSLLGIEIVNRKRRAN
ncbi:hypothetical protein [Lapidilactobacillus wuchangensis]|uniref:hypothetical protein n=1 Tax=Lapidilactobacillus wuchangensis TaxID=2486001 RepID=UPI000F7A797A|nr:hypothetical protein [Lapidilactobacillus wuchangensis]